VPGPHPRFSFQPHFRLYRYTLNTDWATFERELTVNVRLYHLVHFVESTVYSRLLTKSVATGFNMDRIGETIRKHGNVWTLQTNNDMQELFEPLHAARAESFQDLVVCEKRIKYGASDRHRLDVRETILLFAVSILTLTSQIYYPASKEAASSLLVVVFFHGGGFVSGDNDITP
jgi:acetyl esterase/lipase